MRPTHVLETSLYTTDVERAEAFYTTVLGLRVEARMGARGITLQCGKGFLLIFDVRRTSMDETDTPRHGATGPGHVAFAMDANTIDAWRAQLHRHGVVIEREVDWPSGGRSLFFRDPAGNCLELATPGLWGQPPL